MADISHMDSIIEKLPLKQSFADSIHQLISAARFLEADALLRQRSPIEVLSDPALLLLAGRAKHGLGAIRGAWALFLRAWRHAPDSLEATAYAGHVVLQTHSPWHAWKLLNERRSWTDKNPQTRALACELSAAIRMALSDFSGADHDLEEARKLDPENDFYDVARANFLLQDRRLDEAESAARAVRERNKANSGAAQIEAMACHLSGRTAQALAILEEARAQVQSAAPGLQAAQILEESGQPQRVLDVCQKILTAFPGADLEIRRAVSFRRARALLVLDRKAEALEAVAQLSLSARRELADCMDRAPANSRRVLLEVPFVLQRYNTCAPASMAMVSAFHGQPIDHDALVREITYDGTLDSEERAWLESHGWAVRECSFGWDSMRAAVDAKFPVLVTSVDENGGHVQVLCGYDERLGCYLVRDPNTRSVFEWDVGALEKARDGRVRRCLLMSPPGRRAELEALKLSDASLWDDRYRALRALSDNSPDLCAEILARMQARAPDHPLTLECALSLASFRRDIALQMEFVDRLLSQFPESSRFRQFKYQLLCLLARHREAVDFLDCDGGTRATLPQLAKLRFEACLGRADRRANAALCERALRRASHDPDLYRLLSRHYFDDGRREEALFLSRSASTLSRFDETQAIQYFWDAWFCKRENEALAYLEGRSDPSRKSSCEPLKTLSRALDFLNRQAQVRSLLEQSEAAYGDDPEFQLFKAEQAAGRGDFEQAERALAAARGGVTSVRWHDAACFVAAARGDFQRALALRLELLKQEPRHIPSIREAGLLIARLEGGDRQFSFIEEKVRTLPACGELETEFIGQLRAREDPRFPARMDDYLERNPFSAWAHREKAIFLLLRREYAQALACAQRAFELEPFSAFNCRLEADILLNLNRRDEADARCRDGVRLHVGEPRLIDEWMRLGKTVSEQRQYLAEIESAILAQRNSAGAVEDFVRHLSRFCSAPELAERLEKLVSERPDLPQMHHARVVSLLAVSLTDEALACAESMASRFPALPETYLALAQVCRQRSDADGEAAVLRRAVAVCQNWDEGFWRLADCLFRQGELAAGDEVMREALRRNPFNPILHLFSCDMHALRGDWEAAVGEMRTALELAPENTSAWSAYQNLLGKCGRRDEALAYAQKLSENSPNDPVLQMTLAHVLAAMGKNKEAEDAAQRAVALNPNVPEYLDRLAEIQSQREHFEDAILTCRSWRGGEIGRQLLWCREALVRGHKGEAQQMQRMLRDLLKINPHNPEGIRGLALWARTQKDMRTLGEAAELMAQAAPLSTDTHIFRGDIFCEMGDKVRARQSYKTAYEMLPNSEVTTFRLFDMCMQDADYDACRAIIDKAQLLLGKLTHLYLRMRLGAHLVRWGDVAEALSQSRSLDFKQYSAVENLVSLLAGELGAKGIYLIYKEWIARADVDGRTIDAWVRYALAANESREMRRSVANICDAALRCRAHAAILGNLGAWASLESLERYVKRYAKDLLSTPDLRCLTGWAFLEGNMLIQLEDWVGRWTKGGWTAQESMVAVALSLSKGDVDPCAALLESVRVDRESPGWGEAAALRALIFAEDLPPEWVSLREGAPTQYHMILSMAVEAYARAVRGWPKKRDIKLTLKELKRYEKAYDHSSARGISKAAIRAVERKTGVRLGLLDALF